MTGTAGHAWNVFVRAAATRPVLIAAVFFIGLWGVLAAADESATAPAILDVRLGVDAEGQTRIVFDADARPDFVLRVLEDERLAVTIRGAAFTAPGGQGTGAVSGWLADGETATLRLADPALPVRSFILPPGGGTAHHRLVIDLGAVSAADYAAAIDDASAGPQPSSLIAAAPEKAFGDAAVPATLAPAPSLKPAAPPRQAAGPAPRRAARAQRAEKVVVIDPGHGGFDPGASGPTGAREETVNLEAALALRTVLQARGYEVILTRDDDTYVDHDERVEIARRAHADLFLSLHADAHEDAALRGASVYTLSEKRAGRMNEDIKRSGDFTLYDVDLSEDEHDVGDILFDLASTETRNASGRLAATLVDELSGRVPMVNNTHRRASLRVLLSPDVPAVLVEMAFISNPQDEANLMSGRWRRRAMTAVADGIDAYFGAQVALADGEGRAGG